MLPSKNRNEELFNDGVLNILKVDMRTITDTIFENMHFGNKTVGAVRFYAAATAGSNITKMISVPFNNFVNRSNLIEINDLIYSIKQIQEKHDSIPPSMYLTLERSDLPYVDSRAKG